MDLKEILSKKRYNKKVEEPVTAESIKRILEEDLVRLMWEMNFRLLSDQGLQERILWVDTVEVTQVSVRERKQSLFEKIKNLFHSIWKRRGTRKWNKSKKLNRKEGRRI